MHRLKHILLLILALLVLSCHKELDYDDLGFKPQMVLNGLIYQDSVIIINVSRTKSILESNKIFPFLDSAEVRLYENDQFVEEMVYDSLGFYHSSITAKANTNYRIEAQTEEIEPAYADFSFKEIAGFSITNIAYEMRDTLLTYDDITEGEIWYRLEHPEIDDPIPTKDTMLTLVMLNFDMVFTDNAEEENYYLYNSYGKVSMFYHSGYSISGNRLEIVRLEEDNSIHLSFRDFKDRERFFSGGSSSVNGYSDGRGYMNDRLINGREVALELKSYYYTGELQPIEFNLFSYPYEYIHFHTSGYRYIEARDNPFSQPTNVYSNVENGLGIVCAVSASKQTIDFSK